MKKIKIGMDVGIDLGSSSVKIYTHGRHIALSQPAMVAVDRDTDEILAFGSDARQMLGRTPEHVAVVNRIFMPRVVVCVPSGVSEVEKREVVESLRAAGARKVCLIETVVAAALGAGLDISQPRGCMVCDIGAGTTDIGVMTLNGTASSHWIKYAGNSFNEALTEFIVRKYDLLIGPQTAERIKKEIGCVIPRDALITVTVKGRHFKTGMPHMIRLNSEDIAEAFEEPAVRICRAVQHTIEETPPALAGDLLTNGGITLTGGGARLYGMDRLIAERTKLNVAIAQDPEYCVALGAGKAMKFIDTRDKFEKETSPLDVFGA